MVVSQVTLLPLLVLLMRGMSWAHYFKGITAQERREGNQQIKEILYPIKEAEGKIHSLLVEKGSTGVYSRH